MKVVFTALFVIAAVSIQAQLGTPIEIADASMGSIPWAVRDYEDDGDLDFLYGFEFVQVVENLGGGSFQTLDFPGNGAWGDLNGDGLMDIVRNYGDAIQYLENIGANQFAAPVDIYVLSEIDIEHLAIIPFWTCADMDNDGKDEVVISGQYLDIDNDDLADAAVSIVWIDMDVNGDFGAPEIIYQMNMGNEPVNYDFSMPWEVRVADRDEDGLMDVFCGWTDIGHQILYLHNEGAGVFDVAVQYDSYSGGRYTLDDLDGQPGLDILTGRGNGTSLGGMLCVDSHDYGFDAPDPSTFFIQFPLPDAEMSNLENHGLDPRLTNLDNDPLKEIVQLFTTGEYVVFEDVENWFVEPNPEWGHQMTNISFNALEGFDFITDNFIFDYEEDGDDDMIIRANGHFYAVPIEVLPEETANLQLNVYLDLDSDGVMDVEEPLMNNSFIHLTSPSQYYYLSSNGLQLELAYGTYEFVFEDYDPSLWNVASSSAIVTLDAINNDESISIGLMPNGAVDSVFITITSPPGMCNSPTPIPHYINCINEGSTTLNGTVEYTLDGDHTFVSANPTPLSVSGNVITWDFANLLPSQSIDVSVQVLAVPTSAMGGTTVNAVTLNALDESNNIIYTATNTRTSNITCSYDPNDIVEANGYGDDGFILSNGALEYTINFQNTGNAPAVTVSIENQLSDLLDWNTVQIIGWSHPLDIVFDEYRLATFTFNNINLAPAVSNEPASHGFVTYRIRPVDGLNPLTTINNTANIYFDFNPPIVTNTEINTIFSCDMMTYNGISELNTCTGETVVVGGNVDYAEDYTWTFNEQFLGSSSMIEWQADSPGTFELVQSAINPLCAVSDIVTINVNSTPETPVISQNGNVLVSTGEGNFSWSLNGEVIDGANASNIEISESGIYEVVVELNGCSASASGNFIVTGIESLRLDKVTFRPNPVSNLAMITLPNGEWNVSLTDIKGSKMYEFTGKQSGQFSIPCEDLLPGLYMLQCHNGYEVQHVRFVVE